MDVDSAIRGRRSIRKFRPEPVPQRVVEGILEAARWAPSWGNTQSWGVYALTGEALERFKSGNRAKAEVAAHPEPDIPLPLDWPPEMMERTKRMIQRRSSGLAGPKDAGGAQADVAASMSYLFGAPCLLVLCIDLRVSLEYGCLDVGLLAQTICLAAYERGLGTCIMANAIRYPELLREVLPDTDGKLIVISIALGYPDLEAPANRFERERAELTDLVRWVE